MKHKEFGCELTPKQIISITKHSNISPLPRQFLIALGQESMGNEVVDMIPDEIIEQATKMHIDLRQLFLRLIYSTDNTMVYRESLISDIVGIVGTVCANTYFSKKGYKVENEVPIFNFKGKKVTDSDIVLTSPHGHKICVEVKTVKAIINSISEYPTEKVKIMPNSDSLKVGTFLSKENFMLSKCTNSSHDSALQTGEKVIHQLKITRDYLNASNKSNDEVRLCIFKGTVLSKEIEQQLKQYGQIIVLPIDINKIFDFSISLVGSIMHRLRNIAFSVKGEKTDKIPRAVNCESNLATLLNFVKDSESAR